MCFAPPKTAPPPVSAAIQHLGQHMSLSSLTSTSAPQLLFGVDKTTVADVLGPPKARAEHAAQYQTLLLPLLSERLRSKLQAIASFFDASNEDVCLSTQSLDSFVSAVRDMQAKARQVAQEADASKARSSRTAYECQRVTLRALTLVQELIQRHRLQSTHYANSTHCKWLQDREVAMEMKLGLLKSELLCDTYTPDTLAALRIIRDHLTQAQRDVGAENERTDSKLRQYAAAGPTLERLAKEHARVLAEVRDREWALAKMAEN